MKSNVKWDKKEVYEYIKPRLWLYLFRESSPKLKINPENLEIGESHIDILKRVHFLLSAEVKDLVNILPQLMRNLSHSTQKEVIRSQGIIKGRIDWNLTYKERYGSGYNDKSIFMCKPASRMYDLPENQILKYILTNIAEIAETFQFIKPEENIEIEYLKDNWQDDIIGSNHTIKKALNNIYIQNLTKTKRIKPRDLQRLRTHRNRIYRNEILKCYELYDKIFHNNQLETIKSLIGNQLLKPTKEEDLYEIYALFHIIDQLGTKQKNTPNSTLDINLIMAHQKKPYTAQYQDPETTIKIYYQQIPCPLAQNSQYKDILKKYSLNVRSRLPDIILEIEQKNKIQYKIIEIKLTERREYIVDSMYKLLGYLKDFEKCINNSNNPKGILIIWNGIKTETIETYEEEEILILNNKNLNNYKF
ncbi:hypothetical protein [Methanobacterium spitsbergense]|uniref:Uncharacterized protein n=1 Tax=Methanobacterium spitsbergense TaxID=2874285 RepID=A0A8T5V2J5_9EURY|nr:hypothetical protein [Methanobacterium spitsbergense]MBZ2165895.1 hypothetical protein [Methanobacterium spitsbergense]